MESCGDTNYVLKDRVRNAQDEKGIPIVHTRTGAIHRHEDKNDQAKRSDN